MLGHSRWIAAALTIALATYGFDCTAVAMPGQAMQCCQTMHCHAHNRHHPRGEECCKIAAQLRTDLRQPPSVKVARLLTARIGVMQVFRHSMIFDFHSESIARQSHDPPLSASLSPTVRMRV